VLKATARRAQRSRKKMSHKGRVRHSLDELSDEELLDLRMCDLSLNIKGTPLEEAIERLYSELEQKKIRLRPHVWLSDDWFVPDGVAGMAVPFYLAHRRLRRLEEKQMLEVEGGSEEECMRILRHEAGHVLDNAYRLRRRKCWREVFGKASQPYPDQYDPRPYSKSYVLHLDLWYAQSHPVEDFAETFAVWLKPRSRWRVQYQGWPALKKLEFVDELMGEIRQQKPIVASRKPVDPLRAIRRTLRQHYRRKRARYGLDHPDFYDRDLLRLFSGSPQSAKCPSAAAFLRRVRPELRRVVARWTGEYQYTIDQVLSEMIDRCRELNLRLEQPESEARREALAMLTVQTMNYLHNGHHRIAL